MPYTISTFAIRPNSHSQSRASHCTSNCGAAQLRQCMHLYMCRVQRVWREREMHGCGMCVQIYIYIMHCISLYYISEYGKHIVFSLGRRALLQVTMRNWFRWDIIWLVGDATNICVRARNAYTASRVPYPYLGAIGMANVPTRMRGCAESEMCKNNASDAFALHANLCHF